MSGGYSPSTVDGVTTRWSFVDDLSRWLDLLRQRPKTVLACKLRVALSARAGEHRVPIDALPAWIAANESTMRKFAIIVLILIAIPVVWYWVSFPTVSYRYRLTVGVEADGQVHSGSSVIEVWYRFNPQSLWPVFGMYDRGVRGQAVLIDLGARGTLVAALSGENYDYSTVSADALAGRAFQPNAASSNGYLPTLDGVRALSQMQGRAALVPGNLPAFFWFFDPTNLATAKLVKPADFASVIGDSTRLVSAQVGITHDPIVIDIDKKLAVYSTPAGAAINRRLFIARGDE